MVFRCPNIKAIKGTDTLWPSFLLQQINGKACFLNTETPGPEPGPEVIKKISCSAQLSIKLFLLITVKMPTTVGILTFMSRKKCILSLHEPEKC